MTTLAAAVAIDNGLRENHIALKWVMVNAFTIPSLFFELKCVYDMQIIIAFSSIRTTVTFHCTIFIA